MKTKPVEMKENMDNYKCKKESAMKKHMKTKHYEQNCNVCEKVFPTKNNALKHQASECGKDIKDDTEEKDPAINTTSLFEEKNYFLYINQLRCFKCKHIV